MKLRLLVSLLLPLSLAVAGCSAGSGDDQCNDGADNDGDGLIDQMDPGCDLNGDRETPDPITVACNDAVDNDGDGLIDTEDPGCADSLGEDEYNEPISKCQDGIDNDGDGLVDFPNDPGCVLTLLDSEEDDCPDGANCPQCSNNIDDDGDGQSDYPNDLGCNSAGDDDEFNADPSICGANVLVQLLPSDGSYFGIIDGSAPNELISNGCGGAGQEHVFIYEPTEPTALVITTNFPETDMDTVVYIRGPDPTDDTTCRDQDAELGCNDEDGIDVSTLEVDRVEPGTYYIVVDAHNSTTTGNYRLSVQEFTPIKEPCDPVASTCAPGLVCRLFVDDGVTAGSETCEEPECNDGEDSDGDGLFDFPDEPGCATPEDNDETDDCFPTVGAGCPQCSNNADDDNDLLDDFDGNGGAPDPGCAFAADTNEIDECIPGVEVIPLTGDGATGTTTGPSDFTNSCSFSTTAPDDVYFFQLGRTVNSLNFSTIGSSFDTVLSVRFDVCDSQAAEVDCQDPRGGGEEITIASPALGNYYVFVDGSFSGGDYVLDVEAVLPAGASCTPGEPGFICESGFTCRTTTCVPAECNTAADDDGDGDGGTFPDDPGCDSPSDDSEDDLCPGDASCPLCGNNIDDDGDLLIDFDGNSGATLPDPGCQSASDNLELDECIPGVTVIELTSAGVTGTTPISGTGSNFTPSCHSSTLSTEDVYAFRNTLDLATLTFSTVGSSGDTVLSVRENDCGDAADELDCQNTQNGGETVTVTAPTQNFFYFVFVDGDFTSGIDYVLNVTGTIVQGNTCDPVDTQFTCASGLFCDGGAGNTCQPTECNTAADDDGDGDGGLFPNDPGCESIDDNDESDSCPAAPCPQCGNNSDDDGDTFIDFDGNSGATMPDMGCESASDNLELDDCIAGVPLLSLSDSGASGTTEASGNSDFSPSCHSSTLSSEDEYAYLNSRDLVSLTFSTVGSTGDTVLYVRQGDCGLLADEIACLNVQAGGEEVTILNPDEDDFYFVFVDGDFASAISYVLNVSGTLGNGEVCNPVDTQFVCDASQGFTCVAGTCQPGECNNGGDDDGDMLVDLFDPGCSSLADNDESDDPNPLPECADNTDNDGDGLVDFDGNGGSPDLGCQLAADDLEESCTDSDTIVSVASTPITGTTAAAANDFVPTCSTSSTAPEIAHELNFPGDLDSLTVNTNGSSFDTVLYMREGECSSTTDFACDDDGGTGLQSQFIVNNVPAGLYYILVDGFSSNSGAYTVSVTGVIKSGEACDAAQVTAGVFTCGGGTTCTAGTCQ